MAYFDVMEYYLKKIRKMNYLRKYKEIVYVPNLYGVFQFFLLKNRLINNVFIFHDRFRDEFSAQFYSLNLINKSPLLCYLLIKWFSLWNRQAVIYLSGEMRYTNFFLKCFKNIVYLEDGVASYEKINDKSRQIVQRRKSIIKHLILGRIYPWFGMASQVKKIYLTGILPVPEIVREKVELINLKQLWEQKTPKEQDEIKRLFISDEFNMDEMNGRDIILLTQPFSEYSGGNFSESDKIEVYRRLVSDYDESRLIIKPHPSEKTCYQSYFSGSYILTIYCPFELLLFMGCKISTAISVNSTAIFTLDDSIEKVISGYDVTPALIEEAKRRNIYDGISNKFKTK